MIHDFATQLGFHTNEPRTERENLVRYVRMKLIANGLAAPSATDATVLDVERLLATYHQRLKLLDGVPSPVDERIERFLCRHMQGVGAEDHPWKLPHRTIILDRHGLAREMSLPEHRDSYRNDHVASYRVRNGVLHNPVHDRRTTQGTFHVVAGGLPVPRDKKSVPKLAFANLFHQAMSPPAELLELPFCAGDSEPAEAFVSLLIRPLVCPEVPGVCPERSMEIRFFAPGSLVSNLDFVESIFGNAGDPYLADNDAALDVEHWTGHTGCVILAPHLTRVTKRDAGLPHFEDATPRQREDGMCWNSDSELYNDGVPFKLTCRTDDGVIVTLIADNYFGYCKKEVKTQISYAANLMGNCEEEHAGGAIAFASFNLGDEFSVVSQRFNGRTFADVARDYESLIEIKEEGYGIDRAYDTVLYIPEHAHASVHEQEISWDQNGQRQSIPLLPDQIYITPSGYKLRIEKHREAPTWRLVGTLAEGVFCHKPCTVSGGGKSEISKSITDYVLHGSIYVNDVEQDLDEVARIFDRDYSDRWLPEASPDYSKSPSRSVLDPGRSLGSVIKLLTPSVDYTDEYNQWLGSIPSHIYALVFIIKRMHRMSEDHDWRRHFTVDITNGTPAHELKYNGRKLIGAYLRVGLQDEQAWRTFKLRQDFLPAQKVQMEDDISASVVVPQRLLDHLGNYVERQESCKFTENCEYRLFQRPDDAIHRGLDKQTEADLARDDNFIVNFEPLTRRQVRSICNRPVDLSQFTKPMQQLMLATREEGGSFVVCSATPRMIDGEPSKNPRYLQTRPDLIDPRNQHVARMGTRLHRATPVDSPVRIPVHSVLVGRRNNPPDYERGFRPLAVYGPLHFQELPELFMDFISSLTGKSPSTTGAGSEGALTKGPFNALLPITDLNNALVSFLLTGMAGFSTPAGHIGPRLRIDHDISLLIPEIWCRLSPEERAPKTLIAEKLMEKVEDLEHQGERIPASILGYRITSRFIRRYVGRVFDNPNKVFGLSVLRPELQDLDAFCDGVKYIAEAHQRVATLYFEDGSYERACPPLKALLSIMAKGDYEGKTIHDAEVRQLFTLESMLDSDWYQQRLQTKQQRDISLRRRQVEYLEAYLQRSETQGDAERLELASRMTLARQLLAEASAPEYLSQLHGFLGADAL
ncbi:MAG: hypothetical protein KDB14_01610 [Planctomycetales bacterium]|nr:hypothetical protein [Planctomycetales bacterium]